MPTLYCAQKKVGLILATGGLGDKSFNDISYAGCQMAKDKLGVDFDYVEPKAKAEYEGFQRDFAMSGEYILIVCIGFDQADALSIVAADYPEQNFALVDMVVDNPNVASLTFRANEGSFLVGVVAGMMTETGKVGFVGGMDIPLIRDFFVGYEVGAKWANPGVTVSEPVFVGSWADPMKGKELAIALVEQGNDAIYSAAGKSGLGALEAAHEEGVMALGVDLCQCYLHPEVVASMTKRVDEAIYQMILDALVGQFQGGLHNGGIEEGWIGLCRLPDEEPFWEEMFEFQHDELPAEVIEKVIDAKSEIVAGDLTVPSAYTQAQSVEIGVIAPNGIDEYAAIISMANDDINDYMASKGLDYSFTYFLEDAEGQAAIHLEHVQRFRSMGVNLLIGGGWSSQARDSLSYVNENDMLLFSPSSNYDDLAIPDDNLFRLTPSYRWYSPAMADVVWSWGIDAVMVLFRGDMLGIYEQFDGDYRSLGGKEIHGYGYEPGTSFFQDILSDVEARAIEWAEVYGREHVGLLLISTVQEGEGILLEAKNFPTIYDLKWFSLIEGLAKSQHIIETMPSEAEHLKLFSVDQHIQETSKARDVEDRFTSLVGMPFTIYTANLYDICWIYALSVFATGSVDAITIKNVLPEIAAGYEGITGHCELDGNGDRAPFKCDVWGVGEIEGSIQPVKYAFYDYEMKETVWDTDLITPVREGIPPIEPVNMPPFAVINGPYSGEEDGSISFSSAGSRDPDGDIVEFRWTFGDGAHSYEQNPSHTYSEPGTYTVRLSVTDNAGASDSETTTCKVTPMAPTNQAPVAAVNGPYSGEEEGSISFSSAGSLDPDGNIVEYRWDFGDGQTSVSANPSHTYEEVGTYTVTLRVTDNQGATNTATTSCTVEAAPPPEEERGGFPWLPVLAVLGVVAVAAAFFYLQKMKPRVKVRKPVEFDIEIEPKEIPADGRSTAIITIGLLDDVGKPIEATEEMAVTISASGGVVVSSSEVKRDVATGAATITDSVRQAIEGLLSRKEEAGMRISIGKGEARTEAAIVSSLEVGDVTLSVSAPGMRRRTVRVRFIEKRRYCMHCGARMSIADMACPKCNLMPPSGVDVKSCPNCGEVIPSVARFCSECGAGQPA